MKISIIVPCYNVEKYLEKCVESIMNQDIDKSLLEIILVNDASADGTWDKILELENRYEENVIAINLEKNMRQGGARNQALMYASGDYIYFLDADDWFENNILGKIVELLEQYNVDVLQATHYNVKDGNAYRQNDCKEEGLFDISGRFDKERFILKSVIPQGCCGKFYKRELIEKNNIRFKENVMYEEPSFVFPVLMASEKIYCLDEAIYYYLFHEESTMRQEEKRHIHIRDHVGVQLDALIKVVNMEGIMEKYYTLVEYYFVNTFYVETMFFLQEKNIQLDEKYVEEMKGIVRSYFPNCRENAYIVRGSDRIKNILDTVFEYE